MTIAFHIVREKCAVHDSVSTVLEDLISQLEQLVLNQKKVANELNEIISDQKELNKGEERLEKMLHGKHHTRHCVGKDTGIHEIVIPSFSKLPFQVVCDAHTRGGNWTIILRRLDGSVDFYRKWADYKAGFGNLNGEFFLGLEKINALTNDKPQELFFLLEDYEGETRYEQYDAFAIGDELDFYQLHTLGKPHGTAEDSFTYHVGSYFSSQDRDHDQSTDNCAVLSTGGWWYKDCHNRYFLFRLKNKETLYLLSSLFQQSDGQVW